MHLTHYKMMQNGWVPLPHKMLPPHSSSQGVHVCRGLPWYPPGMPALQLSSLFVLDSLQWCHSVGRSRGCMSACLSAVQLDRGWGVFPLLLSCFEEPKLPELQFMWHNVTGEPRHLMCAQAKIFTVWLYCIKVLPFKLSWILQGMRVIWKEACLVLLA